MFISVHRYITFESTSCRCKYILNFSISYFKVCNDFEFKKVNWNVLYFPGSVILLECCSCDKDSVRIANIITTHSFVYLSGDNDILVGYNIDLTSV